MQTLGYVLCSFKTLSAVIVDTNSVGFGVGLIWSFVASGGGVDDGGGLSEVLVFEHILGP